MRASYRFEWLSGRIPEEERSSGVYVDDGGEGCWTTICPKPRTERQRHACLTRAIVDFRKNAHYERLTRCRASLYVERRCMVAQVFLYIPKLP